MCEVERTQRPDMGWYCKKTGKPIIHTTPLGMYCEDKCGFEEVDTVMKNVNEMIGGNPQELLKTLMQPGGFQKAVKSLSKKLDTQDMRELYKRQKKLNPNLDKDVEQFDANIEEIFRHGNNSRK